MIWTRNHSATNSTRSSEQVLAGSGDAQTAPAAACKPLQSVLDRAHPAAPVTEVRLVEGLPVDRLEHELLLASRSTDVGHRILAFYLHEMHDRGLHQLLGFASAVHFAQLRLDLSRRQARDLLATGAALSTLRRVDQAFADGRLSWTKTRLLARIAEPETEAAWLEKALALPAHQLERLVARSEKGRPPREDVKGLPEVQLTVKIRLDPVQHETWEQARRKLSAHAGEEIQDGAALAAMARLTLGQDDGDVGSRANNGESPFRIVIDRCPSCRAAALRTDDGPLDIEPATAEMIACEAPALTVNKESGGARAPSTADPRQLPHGIDRPTSPALRDRILARDGYRCRSCGRRQDLMVHHLVQRSVGGRTAEQNLAALCSCCHALVHQGLLRIEGEAPHGLRFLDAEGCPLTERPSPSEAGSVILRIDGGARPPSDETEAQDEVCAKPLPTPAVRLPRDVDASWWRSHAHLITWHDRRSVLEMEPGQPVAPEAEPEQASSATPGTPAHRPASLDEIIGQARVVDGLRTAVAAARKESRPVAHVLCSGPAGLGKTSLALAVAAEMGTRPLMTSGPALAEPPALIGLLTSLCPGDVLFLDEIHALPRKVAELLYEAMEDRTLSLPIVDRGRTRTLTVHLEPFTLMGATTDPDRVPSPLIARFPIHLELEAYGTDDLVRIVKRAAERSGIPIDDAAAHLLAGASLGTPRQALRIWTRVHEQVVARARHRVTVSEVQKTLEVMGLDQRGLGPIHQKALDILRSRGPGRGLGSARLAARLGLAPRTFRAVYERDLIRLDLVSVTSRGLMAG